MEEPELRVGGWEKEGGRRWLKRIFSLIMIVTLAFLLVGPSVINYNPAYVPSDSLYLENGMWNGPFDINYSKEYISGNSEEEQEEVPVVETEKVENVEDIEARKLNPNEVSD